MGGDLPIVPLVGMSSVAQPEENLAAVALELTEEQRGRLDAAN
jgi:aryl-alcohol dehydrogenase-like predicted oxidoreductase